MSASSVWYPAILQHPVQKACAFSMTRNRRFGSLSKNSTSRTHLSTSGGGCNNFLPLPARTRVPPDVAAFTHLIAGTGEARTLVTDLRRIGLYVARIVADPQTLNHPVIAWDEEVQSLRAHEIGERVSGEGDAMKAKRIYLEPEQVVKAVKEVKEEFSKHPDRPDLMVKASMIQNYWSSRRILPRTQRGLDTTWTRESYIRTCRSIRLRSSRKSSTS
ncbi:hypothetical protein BD311DRAFT_444503 [Dichomitus squalens]|uniref:Uncharacterized protein n=1 Tax=Dichomitus squalens TaxID=114155 RepID=A0A4Q9MGA5_9APHY|nr:hypothetical protein BD311DRAFT_444503 [Dichomitus squalens]